MNNFQSSYQFKPDGFTERNAAFEEQSRKLQAIRSAKVKAFRATNPGVSASELMQYEQKLKAQDDVALAPAYSDVRQAQMEEQAMQDGFDPKTGNRLTDIWGSPVNAPNGALQAAIRKDTPGSMAVDFGKYNRGEVEQWGHGGLKASAMPMSIKVGLADRMALNKAIEDPILAASDRRAKEQVYAENQIAAAARSEKMRSSPKGQIQNEIANRPNSAAPINHQQYSFDPEEMANASLSRLDNFTFAPSKKKTVKLARSVAQ
jgi:hypothetical protein